MKTVIRIEYLDGWGLFRSYLYEHRIKSSKLQKVLSEKKLIGHHMLDQILERHQNFNTPYKDSLNMYLGDKTWFCAFKSVEQLLQWVTLEELKELQKHDYSIYEISVNEFQEGEHQVVFTKESIITKRNINHLFQ